MTTSAIQTNFGTGEWAPKLRARVDTQRYRTGAARMRNFYVDFSGGGASTRPGTKFVNQCKAAGARLVGFQPSVNISYILEFGQNYLRFYSNGAPILESAVTLGGALSLSPAQFNNAAGYVVGDWITFSGVQGMTPVGGGSFNGNYYIVASIVGANFTVTDLFGNPVAGTGSYIANSGTTQRVYTITTPYNASDLFPNQATGNPGIKWVQDVTSLIICHPSYNPYILTITSANNWSLSAITFGPTITAPKPTGSIATNITGTGWFYAYIVTAVDNNGQESVPSTTITNSGAGCGLINTTNPSNLNFGWPAVPGAVSYNVYKASPQSTASVAAGAQFGFVGNVTGTTWEESFPGIGPDFSQTPPIVSSPIIGGNVTSINLTASGSTFTFVPTVTIAAPPAGGFQATASATLMVVVFTPSGTQRVNSNNGTNPTGQTITYTNGITALITAAGYSGIGQLWNITGLALTNPGSIASGSAPGSVSGTSITNPSIYSLDFSLIVTNWGVGTVKLIQGGFGYTSAPSVTFTPSGGAAAFTTVSPITTTGSGVLGAAPVGNPRVPGFYQERLTLASPNAGLQSFYMSQPGSFFNFNTSNPSQADDAIFGSIVSEELNDIRSLVSVPTGILALTGKGAWLINGGGGISTANPITPSNLSATPQAFSGANDVRPLKVQRNALYVTNKGNYVRDANYNIYMNIFVGEDITAISNHLFFGYSIVDWAWAEEPFKTIWAVRSDGQLLSLGYVKEQELIGWAHHDTNGAFTSIASVIETVGGNTVDAVYVIVQRLVSGTYVNYVERLNDRYFPYGYEDSWCVDCALQTSPAVTVSNGNFNADGSVLGASVAIDDPTGPFTSQMATDGWVIRAGGGIYKITAYASATQVTATVLRTPSAVNPYNSIPYPQTSYTIWQPTTTVSGLTQLIGQSVVGVADGAVVGPLTVSASGTVTLSQPASKITLGLSFLPQLQTLPLDLGEPTIQGKRKKIVAATVRVADTLGLQIGKTFNTLVTMKDFQIGAIPSTSSGPVKVTDLVNPSTNVTAPFIDGRTIMDQDWESAGSYCIQQNLPYPATILGVMPEIQVGDTGK